METLQTIETIGSITKFEQLRSVEYNVLPNTLVLENTDPFPGYGYQGVNLPSDTKPRSIFLVLRYRYAPEKIARISVQLAKIRNEKCRTGCGEIEISSRIYPCIRLKSLACFADIPEVQNFYKDNEIKFMGYHKIDAEGKITIHKNFKIIETTPGIYRDLYDGEKFYIKIPKQINWKTFESVSKFVKNNIRNGNFDAALGMIYRFTGVEEVIRIYDRNKSLERALEIKNMYNKALKKEFILV
jgi:hypothetical protein